MGWLGGRGEIAFLYKKKRYKERHPPPIDEEIQTPAGCEDVPIQFEEHTQERKGKEKKKKKKHRGP